MGEYSTPIEKSLERAGRKTFVRTIKPLRGLLRDQGAVNDSLIEALRHLAEQTREILEEMSALQSRLDALEAEIRQLPPEENGADAGPQSE